MQEEDTYGGLKAFLVNAIEKVMTTEGVKRVTIKRSSKKGGNHKTAPQAGEQTHQRKWYVSVISP